MLHPQHDGQQSQASVLHPEDSVPPLSVTLSSIWSLLSRNVDAGGWSWSGLARRWNAIGRWGGGGGLTRSVGGWSIGPTPPRTDRRYCKGWNSIWHSSQPADGFDSGSGEKEPVDRPDSGCAWQDGECGPDKTCRLTKRIEVMFESLLEVAASVTAVATTTERTPVAGCVRHLIRIRVRSQAYGSCCHASCSGEPT